LESGGVGFVTTYQFLTEPDLETLIYDHSIIEELKKAELLNCNENKGQGYVQAKIVDKLLNKVIQELVAYYMEPAFS